MYVRHSGLEEVVMYLMQVSEFIFTHVDKRTHRNMHTPITGFFLCVSGRVCNLNCSGNGQCIHVDPDDPTSSFICACYTGWKGTDCDGWFFICSFKIKTKYFTLVYQDREVDLVNNKFLAKVRLFSLLLLKYFLNCTNNYS